MTGCRKLDIERTCKCELHDDLLAAGDNKTYRLHKKSSHDYSKKCMNWLIEKKYLLSSSTYFCSIWLDYTKEKGSIATKAANKLEKAVTIKKLADKNDSVLKVAKVIKNGKIKNDEMNLLCKTTGKSKAKNIFTRIQNDSPETHYNHLILNDMKIRVEAPAVVINFINQNESFSRSGDPCRGEGGDYITETENKYLKLHLSPCIPIVNIWIKASRNNVILTKNQDAVLLKEV